MITLFEMDFVETFMILYNAGAAFILIYMIGQILLMMRRVDRRILMARLFLNDSILHKTWIYISIAGASFAINNLLKFITSFSTQGEFLKIYHMQDITQIVFFIAFILALQNWYGFIGTFNSNKTLSESCA